MRITVRAFTKDGYHRDILIMNERQVLMNNSLVKEPKDSVFSGLVGHGGSIELENFPMVVKFEVVLEKDIR